MCGIFYGVFIESAFKRLESPHHIAAWWGWSQEWNEAFSPSPSMLTPYSIRHASTTIWRGVRGGGKGRGGFNPLKQSHVSGSGWYLKVKSSSVFSQCSFYPPLFFLPTLEGQTLTPTCCSSSLTKGTIYEPHWFKASISWLCFPHPELLIGTLAMKIPRANKEQEGKKRETWERQNIFWILVKILVLHLLSSEIRQVFHVPELF